MAERGDGEAHLAGRGVRKGSYGLAEDKWRKPARGTSAVRRPATQEGCRVLQCLTRGLGGPQDNVFGIMNLTQAAELGSNVAAFLLGQAFFSGTYGLPKDNVRARFTG